MSDFKPMLAKDGDLDKLTFPVLVQPKLDGIRACVIAGPNGPRLVSRTLKSIPNAEIREALERPEFVGLDGELIVGEPNVENVYNRTVSFVMSESKTGAPWSYMVFDKWDLAHEPYEQRLRAVERVREYVQYRDTPIFVVATQEARARVDLDLMEALMIEQGYEGAIVRTNAPYKFGRSGKTGPLLKVKRFIDYEARIVGVYEQMHNANAAQTNALGRTERSTAKAGLVPAGVLGGLVVEAINGPYEGVQFEVGTGFTAADRLALWEKSKRPFPHGLTGRIVKVKSFPVGVKDKPRHPVFLGFRPEGA